MENITTTVLSTEGTVEDVRILAKSFLLYKIAEGIKNFYFPVLVPVGVIGNFLSFLVMLQKHNRSKSFSLYISALAVADTVALLIGLTSYLRQVLLVDIPPNQKWNCKIANTVLFMTTMASTLFIVAMTFERFYSIIRPHKAASFNTVKRSRVTLICVIIFSIFYNIPHIFVSSHEGRQCIAYGTGMDTVQGQFYYWLSFNMNFILPFTFLLGMNTVIIHVVRSRSTLNLTRSDSIQQGQVKGQGQSPKAKNSDTQITVTLLFVTFGFLILTTPTFAMILYTTFVDFFKSPKSYADFYLFYHVSHKTYYTNYGINFFLYVISGRKFRKDLIALFRICKRSTSNESNAETSTRGTSISNSYM